MSKVPRRVEDVDTAADAAVREVSSQLDGLIKQTFGPEAIYKTLTGPQRNRISAMISVLVYDATKRNLGDI